MKLSITVALIALLASLPSFAQESTDAADVWTIVEAQWNAEEAGDKRWADRMLAENFTGWSTNSPAPRSKESTKMWDRFNKTQGKNVIHELYPLSIVIEGDVAVAHYLFSAAYEDKDGEVEINSGRYTDVLVRTEDGWKFIAWHGGEDD